jgi:hypothetical protein
MKGSPRHSIQQRSHAWATYRQQELTGATPRSIGSFFKHQTAKGSSSSSLL